MGHYNNVQVVSIMPINSAISPSLAIWSTFDPRRDLQLPPETVACLLFCHKKLFMHVKSTVVVTIALAQARLHRDSDQDPDSDWLQLHGGKLDSNPDSIRLPLPCCQIRIRIRDLVIVSV